MGAAAAGSTSVAGANSGSAAAGAGSGGAAATRAASASRSSAAARNSSAARSSCVARSAFLDRNVSSARGGFTALVAARMPAPAGISGTTASGGTPEGLAGRPSGLLGDPDVVTRGSGSVFGSPWPRAGVLPCSASIAACMRVSTDSGSTGGAGCAEPSRAAPGTRRVSGAPVSSLLIRSNPQPSPRGRGISLSFSNYTTLFDERQTRQNTPGSRAAVRLR